jgi:hydrogenase maturation protease
VSATSLLVGIGSPHGDDRVGWEIARRVGERLAGALDARCARTPAELLDWLEGVDALDVCDAFAADGQAGSVHCWQWPARQIERVPFCGSHDVSLPAVLALAERLGRLPPRVRIWGVGIKPPAMLGALSPGALAAVEVMVDRICGELAHA